MFETLCQHAIPTAIVTGGDAHVGRAIQRRLGTDALYATELEEVDGKLTGQITGKLLDETAKVRALDDFCIKTAVGLRNAPQSVTEPMTYECWQRLGMPFSIRPCPKIPRADNLSTGILDFWNSPDRNKRTCVSVSVPRLQSVTPQRINRARWPRGSIS